MNEGMKEDGGRGGGGGLGGGRVVVFEMIRPICASFPRCTLRPSATRVAANRRGFRTTASSVEALLNATFRGKDEVGEGEKRERDGAFAARRMKREVDRQIRKE